MCVATRIWGVSQIHLADRRIGSTAANLKEQIPCGVKPNRNDELEGFMLLR